MRRPFFAVVLALILAVPCVAQTRPSTEARRTLDQMLQELREARGLAAGMRDAKDRKKLEQLLDQVELKARRLSEMAVVPASPVLVRRSLSDTDFNALVAAMKKEAFDDGRLAVLNAGLANRYFSTAQAKQLVGMFKFSDGQKKSALALYVHLLDQAGFADVVSVMTFGSDRQEVLKAVQKK